MNGKNKPQVVLTSLDQLGQVAADIELKASQLEMPDFSGVEQDAKKKALELAKVRKSINTAFDILRTADDTVAKYAIAADDSEEMDEETREDMLRLIRQQVTDGKQKMLDYIDGVFVAKDIRCRQAAAVAYVRCSLSRTFLDGRAGWDAVHDLIKRGVLVENRDSGKLEISYRRYDLGKAFEFDELHIARLSEVIEQFSRHLMAMVQDERVVKKESLVDSVTMTLTSGMEGENCKGGIDGTCLITVPAETYQWCNTHRREECKRNDGCKFEEQHRSGGLLLLKFDGDDVIPLQAVGSMSIEKVVREMSKMDIRVPRYTLKWKTPPGYGDDQFAKVRDAVMRRFNLPRGQADQYVHGEQLLWNMIQRTVEKENSDKETMAEKASFKSKSVIGPVEFFGLNGSGVVEGTTFLELENTFKNGDQHVTNIFVLVANRKNGDGMNLEVVQVPKHLEGFLGEFVGKQFPVVEYFKGCPDLLRRILLVMRGTAKRDEQIALARAESANAVSVEITKAEAPAEVSTKPKAVRKRTAKVKA